MTGYKMRVNTYCSQNIMSSVNNGDMTIERIIHYKKEHDSKTWEYEDFQERSMPII